MTGRSAASWTWGSGAARLARTVQTAQTAGAARAAGLAVGGDEAVAHGLLLAALSLAVVPLRARGVDLRFTAPVAVPLAGGPAMVAVTGRGDLADRRGTALRRVAPPADGGAGDADGA